MTPGNITLVLVRDKSIINECRDKLHYFEPNISNFMAGHMARTSDWRLSLSSKGARLLDPHWMDRRHGQQRKTMEYGNSHKGITIRLALDPRRMIL
ncbi:jg17777 [Pararge aegeria aegeria]|uniref:Jg17777 protein n=1 Tax=Pararge aegeria aegeria TaxID=348720 RepID=A0A8S4RC68_9NEOP|nr:jg17777 [Pararge aegeria aegeria]